MEIQPIKNARNHAAALAEIEALMRAKHDTPKGDRLDVLVTLVQAYEAKHHPIDPPDPIETIRFSTERYGSAKIPRHHCSCKPHEVGAASAQFNFPLAESARLMPVTALPMSVVISAARRRSGRTESLA